MSKFVILITRKTMRQPQTRGDAMFNTLADP